MIDQENAQRQPSQLEVAALIADALKETDAVVRRSIVLIVQAIGRTQAKELLNYALQAEEHGGLLTCDKKRRRTVGGIFFLYVKLLGKPKPGKELPLPAQNRTERARKGPAQPRTPKTAPSRTEKAAAKIYQKGIANTVKITLVGRPGFILDKKEFVVVTMENSRTPALPKGLPVPPSTTTQYGIYISAKSWNKVKDAVKDPEDTLIIEGHPQLDAALGAIAVYATNVTTKKTQQAAKQAQQAKSLAEQKL